jgi:peptidoglycan/LPS O-acetylase OafA/YrhL
LKVNLHNLDCLRGILAVYVLAGHSRWLLWTGHANWISEPHARWENILAYSSASLRYGHEAVMVFFVLSGYFIHLRASQKLAVKEQIILNPAGYFARRAHRLIPPYVLALLLTVVADSLGRYFFPVLYEGRTGDKLLDANFGSDGYSWESVVSALLLLPTGLGKDFGSNGPLWSLAFEVVYYILYPIWLQVRMALGLSAYGLVVILSLLAFFSSEGNFVLNVLSNYYLWIAGAGLAELTCRNRLSKRKGLIALILLLPIFIGLIVIKNPLVLLLVNLGIGVGLVVVFGLFFNYLIGGCLYRGFEILGRRSYTIYICHFPILTLFSAWIFQTKGARPVNGWVAVLGGLLALGITIICFEICEKHFLHARLKLPLETAKLR